MIEFNGGKTLNAQQWATVRAEIGEYKYGYNHVLNHTSPPENLVSANVAQKIDHIDEPRGTKAAHLFSGALGQRDISSEIIFSLGLRNKRRKRVVKQGIRISRVKYI